MGRLVLQIYKYIKAKAKPLICVTDKHLTSIKSTKTYPQSKAKRLFNDIFQQNFHLIELSQNDRAPDVGSLTSLSETSLIDICDLKKRAISNLS